MKAYSRPHNLWDFLVWASTSHKSKSTSRPVMDQPKAQTLSFPQMDHRSTRQVLITDFFKSQGMLNSLITNSCSVGVFTPVRAQHPTISLNEIGTTPNLIKNACKQKKCRYCPNLDRSWKITCIITGKRYTCKKNFTCRSSNLVLRHNLPHMP